MIGKCLLKGPKHDNQADTWRSETRVWDVRTKNVTCESVPTVDGVVGMANYGPTSTLFTIGQNHTVQQYDINPQGTPLLVKDVQHIPANTPPSPPSSIREPPVTVEITSESAYTLPSVLPVVSDTEGSESENNAMSPLQKFTREMDKMEERRAESAAEDLERRDTLAPLSPSSSRTSSVSSRSSRGRRGQPAYLYDQPLSSRASTLSQDNGTEFSFGQSLSRGGRESMSIRSSTSFRSSRLRQEVPRSPEDAAKPQLVDLFPLTKSRLRDVPFQVPRYGQGPRTPDLLRKEMFRIVFGWDHDAEQLVRNERKHNKSPSKMIQRCIDNFLVSHHRPGSGVAILLSKWLGDLGPGSMVDMMGTQSMTSSDWMLVALSSIEKSSQKQVGEAFVHRLLEKGDIHPAVAIYLGLGEYHDAIETYVSQKFFLEALLLTCLYYPSDWHLSLIHI